MTARQIGWGVLLCVLVGTVGAVAFLRLGGRGLPPLFADGPDASRTAAPEEGVPSLAVRVFTPALRERVLECDPAVLQQLQDRVQPTRSSTLSILLHSLHLWGAETTVATDPEGTRVRILDLFFDADRGAVHFRASVPLQETRYGARFPLREKFLVSRHQAGTESHPGQAMSILAELGVPLTQPLRLPGGKAGTLQLVLDDLQANFALKEQQVFWDAAALALYLPPARRWTDKYGREVTFNDLALEILSRPPNGSSCGGTHRLLALTILYRVHQEVPILSPEVHEQLRGHLKTVATVLTHCQRPEGYWELAWFERLPGFVPGHQILPATTETRLITTGHHVEWLLLLPDDLRPPPEVFRQAGRWLLKVLEQQTPDPEWVRELYCPVSHALRAVLVLSSDRGEPLPSPS